MIQKKENGEILYTDLDEHFEPKEALSPYALVDKWRIVPIGTAEYTSNMLASLGGHPEDITLSPNLTGWYKIYLHAPGQSVLHLKLSEDPCFCAATASLRDFYTMEEFLWRCADLSGQSLTLTRKLDANNRHSMLAAIRFVPMSEEEVTEYLGEEARGDTKRLYVTDDMHAHLFLNILARLTIGALLPSIMHIRMPSGSQLSRFAILFATVYPQTIQKSFASLVRVTATYRSSSPSLIMTRY